MSEEWKHASWVSTLGKWAWVLVVLNGVIEIIWYVVAISTYLAWWNLAFPGITPRIQFLNVWYIIWGIIIIIIGFFIIRPKFSNKCANKDWDALYDWVLKLGNIRIPWMLVWGMILATLGGGLWSWTCVLIFIVFLLLVTTGPRQFQWKEE